MTTEARRLDLARRIEGWAHMIPMSVFGYEQCRHELREAARALQSPPLPGGWNEALERWSHVDQDETSFEAIYERHLAGELSFYGAVRECVASLVALPPPPSPEQIAENEKGEGE